MKKSMFLLLLLVFTVGVGAVYADSIIEEGTVSLNLYPKKCIAGKLHLSYQQRKAQTPDQFKSVVMLSKLTAWEESYQWNGGSVYSLPGWIIKRDLLQDYQLTFFYSQKLGRFVLKTNNFALDDTSYILQENQPVMLQDGIFLVLARDPKVPTNENQANSNNFERSYFLFIADCNERAIEYLHAMNDLTNNV